MSPLVRSVENIKEGSYPFIFSPEHNQLWIPKNTRQHHIDALRESGLTVTDQTVAGHLTRLGRRIRVEAGPSSSANIPERPVEVVRDYVLSLPRTGAIEVTVFDKKALQALEEKYLKK